MVGMAQAIRKKEEPGGGVTFLDGRMRVRRRPCPWRVERAQRAVVLPDVGFHPGAGHQRFIASQIQTTERRLTPVTALGRLVQDVEQTGELPPDPFGDAILIGDVVNAQFLNERAQAHCAAILPNAPQRLCQIGLATPDGDVQETRVRAISHCDDPL